MTTINASPPALNREPPSPPEDWWFGHLLPMRENPMEFLAGVARDFGGIVKLRFRKDIVYFVSEPDLLKELLIDHSSKYRKNTRYKHMQRLLGNGILLAEGESWKKQQRLAQPLFTPKSIAGRAPAVAQTAREHLETWKPLADTGRAFDTEHAFSHLTQRQVLQFIVGSMYEPYADAIAEHVESGVRNWPIPRQGRFGSLRPPQFRRMTRLMQAIEGVDEHFYRFIDMYRTQRPEDAVVLGAMVDEQDATSQPIEVRNKQLRDQLVTLFLAAFETSASGLCWTFYLLDQHPEVREKLYEEIDRELAGATPTVEDFPRLPYLGRVIKESLRLYSPIHSLSRVALEDDTIGGFAIPKGSTIMVSLYATHRLPHHWPDPDRFDPDRFLPERSEGRHRYAYIPFAIGPRGCLGEPQAIVNAKINIALIAQRYVLKLAPGHRVEPDARTTMRPKYGMMMTLESR